MRSNPIPVSTCLAGKFSREESAFLLNWMKTKFKCRKHMDHDAKLGGDGRSAMDDYEVVDQKPKDRHERKRHKKQHHKHHR